MDATFQLLYRSVQQHNGARREGVAFDGKDTNALARSELEHCQRAGIRVIGPGDAEWPEALDRLSAPPICLYALGQELRSGVRTLGVVGTRSPTPYGLECCGRLVRPLARRDVEIWSGMARGIDQAAHVSALEAGGITRAVLGAGLLRPYPSGSEGLMRRIAERGTVLSEYPPTASARRHYFPRRNALLAAIAADVLVVQAAERSGSLLTAWMALDLGGTVLAVPDRIDEPLSRGGLALLREGAVPVGSAADLVESLGWELAPEEAASAEDPLLRLLGEGALGLEELALRLGQPLGRALALIARREASGELRRTEDGRYVRTAR
ncbi:MAG: DNA-protecting protein DprA [Planctomycetes bacterium]|nr:DNA-protecting protein DprA [Planctomycetota bacterium]